MKCPRCGAQVEDGKSVCFMCGASINGGGNSSGFGSGDSFSTGFSKDESRMQNGGLDDYNPALNEEYFRKKEEYNNSKGDYRLKKEKINNASYKKDMFDILSEYKTPIRIGILLIILIVIGLLITKWYKKKTAEIVKVPIINDVLYYEVDKNAFHELSPSNGSSGNAKIYVMSGDTGSSCSISVTYGANTSEDFITTYYKQVRAASMADIYDNEYIVKDQVKVPMFQQDQLAVNGVAWHYLYQYYRKAYPGDYLLLKNRYLNTIKDGYVYSVTLTNNDNNPRCNLYLDNFVRSLEFVKK